MKKIINNLLMLFTVLFIGINLFADNSIIIPETKTPPSLDGKLNEPCWQNAYIVKNFKTFEPDSGKNPSKKTIAYLIHDENNLYFAFKAFDNKNKIKTSVKKRDDIFGDDWVGFILDTFNDNQSAYVFIVNPSGIQGDGVMNSNGNMKGVQDFVWYSVGKRVDDGYIVEGRIPLKSIRFPSGKKVVMKVVFARYITRFSEKSSFPALYPDKGSLITQLKPVIFTGLKYKRVVEILPDFVYSKRMSLKEGIMETDEKNKELGLTAKLGLSSDLTLDATYNPDFSQVEADAGRIDINLRYDIFYPEKRPFFQEGSEFFSFAGNPEEAPLVAVVHTRRIINPVYGFKLSGKISKKDSVLGLFSKDEIMNEDNEIRNPYYSILRYKHTFKKDSYIGGFYTGKDNKGYFNRIIGSDGQFRINDKSYGAYHYFESFTKDSDSNNINYGHAMALNYNFSDRKVIVDAGFQDISEDFRIDTGFITRKGISRFSLFTMYQIYPESKIIKKISPFYWSYHLYDKKYKTFETFNLFTVRFNLPLNTNFRIDGIIANEGYHGKIFNRNGYGISINSQITKELLLSVFFRKGGAIYYDPDNPYQGYGNRISLFAEIQPFDKLTMTVSYNYSDFYKKENGEKIYEYSIYRNKTILQLNKYLFFRGIFEYNSYWKKLSVDALASFTYIPGTVVYFGYGSIYKKLKWENNDYFESNNFLQMQKGFFFKISYLYRI